MITRLFEFLYLDQDKVSKRHFRGIARVKVRKKSEVVMGEKRIEGSSGSDISHTDLNSDIAVPDFGTVKIEK